MKEWTLGLNRCKNFSRPKKTLEELDEIAMRWQASEGFLLQYKTQKASNIAQLRVRKVADGC